jgi:hypothetical protein
MSGLSLSSSAPDAAIADPLLCVAEMNLERAAQRLSAVRQKRCECSNYTITDLCQQYAADPKPLTKELILRTAVRTRSDALAVISLLEQSDDPDISAHLLRMIRVHLSAA